MWLRLSARAPLLTLLTSFLLGLEPGPAIAEDIATAIARRPPSETVERVLAEDWVGEETRRVRLLGETMLSATDDYTVASLQTFLGEMAALLSRGSDDEAVDRVVRLLDVIDPASRTFADAPRLRDRLTPVLRRLGEELVAPGRRAFVQPLVERFDPDFDWIEATLLDWKLIERGTDDLEIRLEDVDHLIPHGVGEIRLSVYSMPSGLVGAEEAVALVEDVFRWDPDREVAVFSDGSNLEALSGCCPGSRLTVVPTDGLPYSPWPRDAFTFARSEDGTVVVLLRPNRQSGRERDAELGRSLLQSLGAATLEQEGGAAWLKSPVPFHNGQILFASGQTWVSLHTLERRALELLGLERVPVETFEQGNGLERYLQAVRQAAAELEVLFSQPVRFIHPLPAVGSPEERLENAWRVAGGAGYDLDSLVTILPRAGDLPRSLVASLSLGGAALAGAEPGEVPAFLRRLGMATDPATFVRRVSEVSEEQRSLQGFLDEIADHLGTLGHEVRRVPLLLVPGDLSPEVGRDFLVGVNNAVLEWGVGSPRAEGFSTGLPSLDRIAREAFAWAGYELHAFPLVVQSLLRNAGYRCSSNHLRHFTRAGEGDLRSLSSVEGVSVSMRAPSRPSMP